jgi:DNA polymerase/3'-5' exonuclease PolX
MFNPITVDRAPNDSDGLPHDEPALDNARIAVGLERIAQLLGDGVQSRREALRRAAAIIRFSAQPVVRRVDEAGVEGVHLLGLDYELAGVVTDWVRSGRLSWLEKLEERRSRELSELPGIGPKLATQLRRVLGVVDVTGLARALRQGELGKVLGFGPKRVRALEAALDARCLAQ